MRRGALLVRALVLAVTLPMAAACSDSDRGWDFPGGDGGGADATDYCEAVEDRQKELSEVLAPRGPTALLEALPIFEDLASLAPVDIRDEWDIVIDALKGLEEALEDAEVDPTTYDRDNPPPGLSKDERDRIDAAARGVSDPKTVDALVGVDQQARDVCKTPLYL